MKTKKLKSAAQAVSDADLEISKSLAKNADAPAVRPLSKIAKLGDQPELRLISAGVIIAGLVLGRERLSAAGFRMLVAHELATLAKNFAKDRIDRTRPRSADTVSEATPEPGGKTDKKHTSFPSGHSAGVIAVAQAYSREYPEHRPAALAAAATVAFGQIPKSAHYPTDVAAGVVIGAASEALMGIVWPLEDRGSAAASSETR